MRGLYAIVDLDTLARTGRGVVPFLDELLSVGPCAVQLRAKHADANDALAALRAMAPRCREAGVPLFQNDRVDLALLGGADGVHVGQTDITVADVRRLAPRLRVGLSTHNLAQLTLGLVANPDYLAFGPVFATTSKEHPDPVVGVAQLGRARELTRKARIPLVAIGGIAPGNAREVAARCDAVAVIGALLEHGLAGARTMAACFPNDAEDR